MVKRQLFSIYILIASILFSTMQVVGCKLSFIYDTTVHHHLYFIYNAIPFWLWVIIWVVEVTCIYFLIYLLFHFLGRLPEKTVSDQDLSKRTGYILIVVTIGLILCWVPVLISNLPGFFNYDISGQLVQVMYHDLNEFNSHHSLLSTLVMGVVITLGYKMFGTLFAGVLIYSIFQMLLCSLVFSYTLIFIYRKTARLYLVILGFFFYGFSPTIAMFAMSTTKDVICSLALLSALLFIFEMIENPDAFWGSKSKLTCLIFSLLLSCLFRKNIIYAVFIFAVTMVFLMAKWRKQVFLVFITVITCYFLCAFTLENGLNAVQGGVAEAYSIPFQQIGNVYSTEGKKAFSEEELVILDNLMVYGLEHWKQYNPFISDNLKNYIAIDYFKEHKMVFLAIWFRKFLQYPSLYIEAFFNMTYQAWYPGTSVYDGKIYYFDFYGLNYPIDKTTFLPRLTSFYKKISLDFYYQKIPGIRLLFSIGFMFWVMLLSIFWGLYSKQKPVYGVGVFVLCVCLTCLAGPVTLVRYYLILFYSFPIFIALPFSRKSAALAIDIGCSL